jgi:hypothetical protein
MDGAHHQSVCFELAKLLAEHLLTDAGDGPFELGEAADIAIEKMEEDHQLPSPLQHVEGLFDIASGRDRRVNLAHETPRYVPTRW